jgi:glycosyltransferase involved in cell wall biosynthesis
MSTDSAPLRYLILTTRSQLEGDLDTWLTRMVGDRPMWGPGLPGWDDACTPDENLRRRYGRLEDFDAVFLSFSYTFGDPFGRHWPPPSVAYLGDKPSVGFVHEVRHVVPYEAVWPWRPPTCGLEGLDVVLHPYDEAELDFYRLDNERVRLAKGDALRLGRERPGVQANAARLRRQIFVQVPHHVRTDIFAPPAGGDDARDIDVLLVGRTRPDVYPLRGRWERLLARGQWKNAVHFGTRYSYKSAWTEEERLAQQTEYANLLRRARIVLSCSSFWRYMLQKFTEIPATGAFLVSDVPTGAPPELVENMGIVTMGMSDAELIEVVDHWLRSNEERTRRASRLGAFVRQRFDMANFWRAADAATRRWMRDRGRE